MALGQPDAGRGSHASPWLACPPITNSSYPTAALRAAVIAVVLLIVLAVLVLL